LVQRRRALQSVLVSWARSPQAPPDLIRTVAYGTLLFDSSSSDLALGLAGYRPIEEAFGLAILHIREQRQQQEGQQQGQQEGQQERQQGQHGGLKAAG
jgi:hypothetical protein